MCADARGSAADNCSQPQWLGCIATVQCWRIDCAVGSFAATTTNSEPCLASVAITSTHAIEYGSIQSQL